MKKDFEDDLHHRLGADETLRMENQLLELKLKAELGANTYFGCDIPAEVENAFLKNVWELEKNHRKSGETRICEILGNPIIKPALTLNDRELEISLNEVNLLLHAHNITVDFGGSYDTRTKYKFITEELLNESIFYAKIPGMMLHFIYEEFHPDYKNDLEFKSQKFLSAWFARDTDKLLWEMADTIILPDGPTLSKSQVQEMLLATFEHFIQFSDCNYAITGINFDVNDEAGMALAEGLVNYNALLANQEAIAIQGSFKLCFCLEYGWWDICYFIFPGFTFGGDHTLKSSN